MHLNKKLNYLSLTTVVSLSICTQTEESNTTYVSWTCASNKKQLCAHIEPKWDIVKNNIMEEDRKINEKKDEQDVPLVTF